MPVKHPKNFIVDRETHDQYIGCYVDVETGNKMIENQDTLEEAMHQYIKKQKQKKVQCHVCHSVFEWEQEKRSPIDADYATCECNKIVCFACMEFDDDRICFRVLCEKCIKNK